MILSPENFRLEPENHPELKRNILRTKPPWLWASSCLIFGGDNFMGRKLDGKKPNEPTGEFDKTDFCLQSFLQEGRRRIFQQCIREKICWISVNPRRRREMWSGGRIFPQMGVSFGYPPNNISPMDSAGNSSSQLFLDLLVFWEGEGWGYVFGSFFGTWSWCWCFKTVAVRFHIHMTGCVCVCVMPLQIENIGEKPLKEASTLLSQLIQRIELKRCVCFLAYQDFLS